MSYALYHDEDFIVGVIYEIQPAEVSSESDFIWNRTGYSHLYNSINSVWNFLANQGKVELLSDPDNSDKDSILDVIENASTYSYIKVTSPAFNEGIFHIPEEINRYMIRRVDLLEHKVMINDEFQDLV